MILFLKILGSAQNASGLTVVHKTVDGQAAEYFKLQDKKLHHLAYSGQMMQYWEADIPFEMSGFCGLMFIKS